MFLDFSLPWRGSQSSIPTISLFLSHKAHVDLVPGTWNALILLFEKGDIFLPIISPRHQAAQREGADTFLNSSE